MKKTDWVQISGRFFVFRKINKGQLTIKDQTTIMELTYEYLLIYNIKGEKNMKNSKARLEKCDCTIIHEEVVKRVEKDMPEEESLYDLAELFKVFGDTTRIKILYALFSAEMCVCDIAVLLNMTQSAISHQLRVLKQARLVKYRKEGKVVYYTLDDEHVKAIFDQGLIHINEKKSS